MQRKAQFHLLSEHVSRSRPPAEGGAVVLSRLTRGESRARAVVPSVKFILEGEVVYEVEGRTHRARPGNFLIVDAGTDVRLRVCQAPNAVGMCVHLPPSHDLGMASPGADFVRPALFGSSGNSLATRLHGYAEMLAAQPERGLQLSDTIVATVESEAQEYLGHLSVQLNRLSSRKHSTRLATLERLDRARSYLHRNLDRSVSLGELAAESALSRFHLTRSFTEAFGVPPLTYHRLLRLEHAAVRLSDGGRTPTQVSEELGYASASAFSRAFKSRFGVPPVKALAIAEREMQLLRAR